MFNIRKNVIVFACLAIVGLSASACSNTFHGAGEDIENAGENIQDATN